MRRWVQRRAGCCRRDGVLPSWQKNGEIDVGDQIDEVVREIQNGE